MPIVGAYQVDQPYLSEYCVASNDRAQRLVEISFVMRKQRFPPIERPEMREHAKESSRESAWQQAFIRRRVANPAAVRCP